VAPSRIISRIVASLGLLASGAVAAQDAPQDPAPERDESQPLVAFPHPLITEIFFSVPASGGDASGDGKRSPAGDEFVELMNPHDRPINLLGYELTDRPTASQFRFRFPDLVLAPGEVAVVFNGHDCAWRGPVGDDQRAPEAPHSLFEGAWVFTARAASEYVSFANTAEFVLLTSPAGQPVHAVEWGYPDDSPPPETALLERVPAIRGRSVQRLAPGGPLVEHPRTAETPEGVLTFDLPCSPGIALPGWDVARQRPDGPAGRHPDAGSPK
jgi:hypothetical protein